jgi:outer membrane protein OmpA-like peptidoglycan-associated protein
MSATFPRRHLLRFVAGLGLVGAAGGYVGWRGYAHQQQKVRRWVIAFDGSELATDAMPMLETALDDARLRPEQPIRIVGHTGTVGSLEAKRAQSEERALAIRQRMVAAGVPEARISTAALADQAPLAQQEGESRRAYERRLQRVEVLIGSEEG